MDSVPTLIWMDVYSNIMQAEDVINMLRAHKGVYDVFVMDGSTAVRMELAESKNGGFCCKYENRALNESRSMDLRLCVFSDSFLEAPTEMMTILADDSGHIFGHDVPKGMSREKIGEEAIWVSSTYVMYAQEMPTSDLKFVVLPHSISFLENLKGVSKVVAFNPAISTNVFLRERFGYAGPANATSTIIAVNFSE